MGGPLWANALVVNEQYIRSRLKENGFNVSIFKLCPQFDILRRIVYYKPIKSMIEPSSCFGCRTVAI